MTDRAPERWKYVPEEPDERMIEAGHDADWQPGEDHNDFRRCYKAMLAATPSPPALSGEAEESVTFLRDCASWFRSEAAETNEDRAHWACVYNAENCDKAASLIERQAFQHDSDEKLVNVLRAAIARLSRELAEARAALTKIAKNETTVFDADEGKDVFVCLDTDEMIQIALCALGRKP